MDALIKEEALREPSFTEAWAWVGSELSSELWDKVGMELGLTADELERHWKDRQTDLMRRETYGSGSFIVRHPHRRGGTPKADAQLEDAWWSRAPTQQRAAFLSAYFVETSGYFFISRVEESRCDECAGRGTCETSGAPGRVVRSTCLTCNGCGVVRSVLYR